MTAIPCGQKKRSREMIHSQTVTPPLAAIDGTTLRLNTATTNSSTRSRRPSARIRWGVSDCGVVAKIIDQGSEVRNRERVQVFLPPNPPALTPWFLMRDFRGHPLTAFLLRLRQRSSNVVECGDMLFDIGVGVLDRDRPLLIPPVRLRHHAAVHHPKPVMTPQIDIDHRPVSIIHDFLRIEHERTVSASLCDVSLQSNFRDNL